ncbi:unnamed protein product [Clonostachys chloroleuca]|uniref:Uncharacterized protein n=1 Tax=Clonostachys chloroleuca TaxID=1926264 RepID=A0AA35QF92_9HYPO|nr:unnamed protein product [Clonostachys chloroleuca]
MSNNFFFIDGIQADKNTKKQMRRHVMKGKNVGKKFHRPSKLVPAGPKIIDTWSRSEVARQFNKGESLALDVDSNFGDAYHSCNIPVPVPPAARRIIDEFFILTADRMYPPKLGISLEEAKGMWLKVLFEDQATYECNLAMMQTCNEIYLGHGDSSSKALYSLSRTVSHVKNKLESPDALSDSTMTLVLSLISQEQLKKFDSRAKIHLDGLRRMIELRGGLEQLEGKPPLLLKVCKVDVVFALQFGEPTIFFRDEMLRVRAEMASKGRFQRLLALPPIHDMNTPNPLLKEVLLDVLDVSTLINGNKSKLVVDLINFQEILMSVFYRLLRMHPLQGVPLSNDADAMYHLGLMIFMLTLFITIEKQRILECSPVSEAVRELLDRDLSKSSGELVLWFLLIGAIWTSTVEGDWILPKLQEIRQRLRLNGWEEVQCRIESFPWINVLHDEPGRSLWNRLEDM